MEGKEILKEVWYWITFAGFMLYIFAIPLPIAFLIWLIDPITGFAWGYIIGLFIIVFIWIKIEIRRENRKDDAQ